MHRAILPAQATCVAFDGPPPAAPTTMLAVGTVADNVLVMAVTPDDTSAGRIARCETVMTLRCSARPTAVAWAPRAARGHRVAAGTSDFKIQSWTLDPRGWVVATSIGHQGDHDGYVNSIAFSPTLRRLDILSDEGNDADAAVFASTSDDRTCRVWSTGRPTALHQFELASAGRDVRWHPSDVNKLMVAEESGALRLFDVLTRTMCLTLHLPHAFVPLRSADVCLADPLRYGAITKQRWFTWNLKAGTGVFKQLGGPDESHTAPQEDGVLFRWSHHDPFLFATASSAGVIHFHNTRSPTVPQINNLRLPTSDLAWHPSLPLCVIACDSYLYFWSPSE